MLSGGATIKELAVTPEQAQFLEARKFQVAEVARLFRVPPHMIGDVERSTSWGTGIEQQGIGFTTYTLGSWTTRIERAFSVLLPSPQYVKFNLAALLRADTLTRYQAYEHARNAGLFNIDEIRELEEKPPLPDGKGQDHLQPLNYAPAGSESASGGKGATNGQ
jgi:HK97 family phage portal protein